MEEKKGKKLERVITRKTLNRVDTLRCTEEVLEPETYCN